MTDHATYSPSSMYRTIACPASVMESQFIPQKPPSQYALKGTLLHDYVVKEWNVPGTVEMSDLEVEDQQYVLTCIDYLNMVLSTCEDPKIRMESKVGLDSWGIDEVWGTADVIIYEYGRDSIHVIDWKFGHGVPVYVENNEQAMVYGAAAMGNPPAVSNIVLHIVQPPLDYQAHWEIDSNELAHWVWNILQPAIDEAKSPEPSYNPSEKSCRFCPAANKCRARYEKQMENASAVFQAYRKMPHLTIEEVAEAMAKLKELEQYKKSLFGYAENEYMRGTTIPGWKMVRGRSLRKWKNEQATIDWLDKNAEDVADHMFTQKLISPSQAEKRDRTLKRNEDFQNLITKPPGKPMMVEEKDKRPAIEPNMELENVFKEVN